MHACIRACMMQGLLWVQRRLQLRPVAPTFKLEALPRQVAVCHNRLTAWNLATATGRQSARVSGSSSHLQGRTAGKQLSSMLCPASWRLAAPTWHAPGIQQWLTACWEPAPPQVAG